MRRELTQLTVMALLWLGMTAGIGLAQTRPGQQGQQQASAGAAPDSVVLAYSLLGNSLRDQQIKHETELERLRVSWQTTVATAAGTEAWWHSCIKEIACVMWARSGQSQ